MEIEPKMYGLEVLQDQKANLRSFISQNDVDWATILSNLAISTEDTSFELLEFALLEMRKNVNLLFKILNKDFLVELVRICASFENIAVLIETFASLQDTPIPSAVVNIIDIKLTHLRDHESVNDKLFMNFFDSYQNTKCTQDLDESFKRVVETYQRKVFKTFFYVFQPYYDTLKAKEILFEPMMVWMMIMTHKQNSQDYKCVIDIAKLIKSSLIKKSFWGQAEIDQDQFYKVMNFGFAMINKVYRENELIRPDLNFCVLFEMIEAEGFRFATSKLADRFTVVLETESDITNILGNLFDASYSQNTLILLEILTNYNIKSQKYETLFFVFKNIILKKMLNKLTSGKYFEKTLEILKLYLFGFSQFYSLSYEKTNTFLKNYKIIFRHHKHNLQKFYEFGLCLFHLYRERKNFGDYSDVFDSLRRIKETNGLELPSNENYANLKDYSFDPNPKQIGFIYSLFESHGLSAPKNIKNFKGLQNLGNTCYMNGLLQCLFMTGKFRKEVLNLKGALNQLEKNQLIFELYRLFTNLYNFEYSTERYLVPVEMKSSLPEPFCSTYQQQDACEFSRLLLEEIENQFNNIYKDKNLINSLFYGKVKNTIKCFDCSKSFSRNEDLMDIPLSFNEEALIENEDSNYDLLKMILYFFASEEFSQENSFHCDNCNKKSSKAVKETLILKLPPILILSINRFLYDKNEGIKKKLFKSVKPYYSFNLKDIFPEMPTPANPKDLDYQLYGVIVHSGFSSETGHYFSINKDSEELWYIFNDTVVRYLGKTVNLEEILSDHETPYMFFFSNRSENPLNLNYTERKSLRMSTFSSNTHSNLSGASKII